MTNVENSQKLDPDGEVTLYELTTLSGSTIFFKDGPGVTYLGDEYNGIPLSHSSESRGVENSDAFRSTLVIGSDDYNLGIFKSVLFYGEADGAALSKYVVELDDLLGNVNNKIVTPYTVKQVENYSRSRISLVLGRFSPSRQTTIPHRKYQRPAFPFVRLQ